MDHLIPADVRIFPDNWLRPITREILMPVGGNRLEVDLGCGKGRFLLAHAAAHPAVNFLGIDRMLRRVRKAVRKVERRELPNVRLLRMDMTYAVNYLLPQESISVYYVFFPDPWPKKRHVAHRFFNHVCLDALFRTMRADALVHVATDHLPYFEEIRALFAQDARFSSVEPYVPDISERTDFEQLFIEHKATIGRCSFRKVGAG